MIFWSNQGLKIFLDQTIAFLYFLQQLLEKKAFEVVKNTSCDKNGAFRQSNESMVRTMATVALCRPTIFFVYFRSWDLL